jgi:hypothetical protein
MTVTATTNLSLPIITTGTESGTWGDVVDNGLTSYLDIAIAGGLSVSITTTDVTLTNTAGTSSATNIGSTTAQYAILNITGAKTAARNLIVPSTSKYYLINNNNSVSGGFLLTVKGAATTGVTLVDGERALIAWNGTDYVKIANTNGAGVFTTLNATTLTATADSTFSSTGALTISKGTTVQQPASPVTGMLRYNTTTNAFEGYGGASPAWASVGGGVTSFSAGTTGLTPNTATSGAITLAGTLAIANGGTNSTATPTAGAVTYGNGTAHAFTAAGTTGQSLVSQGSGTPIWGSSIVSGTAVASTSGTSISFTGIPSWVKRITVMLNNVSTSGSSLVQIQLGTSSGVETTGYLATTWNANTGNSAPTTGFVLGTIGGAAYAESGNVVFNLISSNLWVAGGVIARVAIPDTLLVAGTKTLAGTLDRVVITTVGGTDTFDAGSINILYE